MQLKKSKGDATIFSTESEFRMLLQIHNEIKYVIAQSFPFLNQKVIDNLFVILSSQALLYDQIIRKGVSQHDSLKKQTSIGKLIQNNGNNLEKHIIQHLTVLTTNFQTTLSQSKADGFTIINSSRSNKSESVDDSLRIEQESIITRIKRKMKIEKTPHVRTNSVCLSTSVFKQEELKKIQGDNTLNTNNNVNSNTNTKCTNNKVTPAIPLSAKPKIESKGKIKLEKNKKTISNTQNRFETIKTQAQAQPPVFNYQYLHTVSAPNEYETRNNKDKIVNANNHNSNTGNPSSIVLNYKAIGEISLEKNITSGVSKPSNNAKSLTKKYYDIVNTYEKLNSDDDVLKPAVCNNISLHVSEKPLSKRNKFIQQPKLLITLQSKLLATESQGQNQNQNQNKSNIAEENAKKQGGKDKRISTSMKM